MKWTTSCASARRTLGPGRAGARRTPAGHRHPGGVLGRPRRTARTGRRRRRRCADARDQLGRQGARSAADIEDALAGAHAGELGQLRGEQPRVPAHEAVVRLGRDIEAHGPNLAAIGLRPRRRRRLSTGRGPRHRTSRRFPRLRSVHPDRTSTTGHPDRGPVRDPRRQDRDGRHPLRPRRDRGDPRFDDGRSQPARVPARPTTSLRRDARRGARRPRSGRTGC